MGQIARFIGALRRHRGDRTASVACQTRNSPPAGRPMKALIVMMTPDTFSPAIIRSQAFDRVMRERDWLIGAVYFQPGDIDPGRLEYEFGRMRSLGFNAVRFYHAHPRETEPGVFDFDRSDQWLAAAERAGIRVILHLEWFFVSEALLERENMEREIFEHCHGDDPRYQRIIDAHYRPVIERYRDHPAMYLWGVLGEPEVGPALLSLRDHPRFAAWLREQYGTLEALDQAWNLYPDGGQPIVPSFDEAWRALAGLYAEEKISGVHRAMINYGAARDFIAYATDHSFSRARPLLDLIRQIDPNHPIAIGAHQLFVNQPLLRWDIPRWAKLGDLFTTSIHLSWHFELVDGEVDRPVYLQARLTRDADKQGWTSCYETTGGPVQYSGGFGNAMNRGLMRRLTLLYLAAGNPNIAYWTWNPRPGGWEGGEYGMIDLAGDLTPWAEEAGVIARAIGRWHEELWESDDQARIAVLTSWDTDAILCLEPDRHDLTGHRAHSGGTPLQAVRSRLGAGRALINAKLTFHYVDTRELADPSSARYRTIYVPHLRTVDDQTLERLTAFVEAGGRLIADGPFAYNDPWGKLRHAGPDTPAAHLFGAWIAAIHDARTQPRQLGRVDVRGFFADLKPSDGRVIARFDDGSPAIVEKTLGAGSAVLVGCDLSMLCLKPGNEPAEQLLSELVQAGTQSDWRCSTPMAWRRRCAKADHFFLINDGPAQTAMLSVFDAQYTSAMDAMTDQPLPSGPTIAVELPERSARWIRFQRATLPVA